MRKKYKSKLSSASIDSQVNTFSIRKIWDKIEDIDAKLELLARASNILLTKKLEEEILNRKMDAFDRSVKTTKSPFKKSVCSVCKSSDCDLY